MATLFIKLAWSGAVIEISDVNLENITNTELIAELIAENVLRATLNCDKYFLIKGCLPITEDNKTLKEIGFTDGETITIFIHEEIQVK